MRDRPLATGPRAAALLAVLACICAVLTQAAPWVLIASLAVALAALLILLDAFFFAESIYASPSEPTAISGLMQAVPWLALPLLVVDFSNQLLTGLAFVAGVLNMAGFHLYFKALSRDQDAVVVAILWNLMIALVPLLAWQFLDETLSAAQYGGIVLVFAGAMAASFHKTRASPDVIGPMSLAILLMSTTTVLMKFVYSGLEADGNPTPFWSGFLPHAAGSAAVGLVALAGLCARQTTRRHLGKLTSRLWPVFLCIEGIQIAADMLYNFALSLGLASIVAAIDGLLGAFTAGFALLLMMSLRRTRYRETSERMWLEQFAHFRLKLTGMTLIAAGAYLVV